MLKGNKNYFLDKAILMLNLIFVRFDAFLNNYIELTFLGMFLILFIKFTGVQILSVDSMQFLLSLNILVVSSHYAYSIVYVINDFLDFESIRRLKLDKSKYSFYRLRPIIYYNRSITIMLYLITLYTTSMLLLSISLTKIVILYSPLLIISSFIHSRSEDFRPITFACLRTLKYALFLTLIYHRLYDMASQYIVYAFITLTLSFSSYHIIMYMKSKAQLWQTSSYQDVKLFIAIFLTASILLLILLIHLNIAIPFTKSLLITFTPFLLIRQLLRLMLGAKNPDVYVHIKRLTIFFTVTVILSIIIFEYLLFML